MRCTISSSSSSSRNAVPAAYMSQSLESFEMVFTCRLNNVVLLPVQCVNNV